MGVNYLVRLSQQETIEDLISAKLWPGADWRVPGAGDCSPGSDQV